MLRFCSELITSFLLQVWIPGVADPRLCRYLSGAGQDASLRQAQHFLWYRLRSLPLGLDSDKARSVPNLDILQVMKRGTFIIMNLFTGYAKNRSILLNGELLKY